MIIVSQDKKTIFNFDNIEFIEIAENKRTIRCQCKTDINCWLGNYKPKERAKEVLDEIIDFVSISKLRNVSYEEADIIIKFRKMAKYEMPKE